MSVLQGCPIKTGGTFRPMWTVQDQHHLKIKTLEIWITGFKSLTQIQY